MAEKSLVKEEALIDGGGAAAPELLLELLVGVPLLPHAATRSAAPVAIEVSAIFLLRRFNETTFAREPACMSTVRKIVGRSSKTAAVSRWHEQYAGIDEQAR
jgi:hypothetical protein